GIGGPMAASGGIPPYEHLWTVIEPTYPAWVYLDSDKIPSLRLQYLAPGPSVSLHFVLKVTDGSLSTAFDTVVVFFSKWACAGFVCELSRGLSDTIQLEGNCSGNFRPMTYAWSPG